MIWLVRAFAGLAGLTALLGFIGLVLPANGTIERELDIDRAPAAVFELATRLESLTEWSALPARDLRAVYGVEEVGEDGPLSLVWRDPRSSQEKGRMTLVYAVPSEQVRYSLEFPGHLPIDIVLEIEPRLGGSTVRWRYDETFGPLNLPKRYGWFLIYEGETAQRIESSLSGLQTMADTLPAGDFTQLRPRIVDVPAEAVAYVDRRVSGDAATHEAARVDAVRDLRRFLRNTGMPQDGPIRVITTELAPPVWAFRVAVPYIGLPRDATPGQSEGFGTTFEGRALRVAHRGEPTSTAPVYSKLEAFAAAQGLTIADDPWEAYPDGDLIEIYVPVE